MTAPSITFYDPRAPYGAVTVPLVMTEDPNRWDLAEPYTASAGCWALMWVPNAWPATSPIRKGTTITHVGRAGGSQVTHPGEPSGST